MFHLGMWRERMRDALRSIADGTELKSPPADVDEWNDAELPGGIGTPLADAAARSDHLMSEVIELYGRVGEQPFVWYAANNTTDAVLRNSYTHPRLHLATYWRENGFHDNALKLWLDARSELRAAEAPPRFHAWAAYNLACVKVQDGEMDEGLELLRESLPNSDVLREAAPDDEDLAPLRDDPRFQELLKS